MPGTDELSKDPVARLAQGVTWITPAAEQAVQDAVQRPFRGSEAGEKVLSFLHGHWLHEPLHVVMTDLPVGAWSVTVIADTVGSLTGTDSLDKVADVSLLIGLLGAVGAAVTGMADWSEIKRERPRRVGSVHALLNVASTGLFAASCLLRGKRRSRTLPRSLAAVGYLVASVSAHLGGNMIYEYGVGVRGQENGVR
ncbi:DUF2231 domain-containing protein [Terriglobus aquaticus]|uniref:DUF2231 domain-containing protein n=1 Tax=Terriglobus aquaticus TaxID=940139 RepID=A0ABW9KFD6_9BACT|nr:DUF2231 domain-containing protein [Terriglobus aquaticus]